LKAAAEPGALTVARRPDAASRGRCHRGEHRHAAGATEATIESLEGLWAAKRGLIRPAAVRKVVVTDARVDTGATTLGLPTRLIRQLGLKKQDDKPIVSSTGAGSAGVYEAVRLTIMGRSYPFDPPEVPDEAPVLIGQLPLEAFDLVIDPRGRKLIGNPAPGGEHVRELF
jgi:hypothetical protein